jgi:hypothetical protein
LQDSLKVVGDGQTHVEAVTAAAAAAAAAAARVRKL